MPVDVAGRYHDDGVVDYVDDYEEEDVVPFGPDRRNVAPAGRRPDAEPAGRQATAEPARTDTSSSPAGDNRSSADDDSEDAGGDDDGDVPDNVDDVKAWVGDDPARAAAALQVERARIRGPRKTLEPWLAELAG